MQHCLNCHNQKKSAYTVSTLSGSLFWFGCAASIWLVIYHRDYPSPRKTDIHTPCVNKQTISYLQFYAGTCNSFGLIATDNSPTLRKRHHRIFNVHQWPVQTYGSFQFNGTLKDDGTHIDSSPCMQNTIMTVYSWAAIRTQAKQLRGECAYI